MSRGYSVTQRTKNVKHPRGGYINPKELQTESWYRDTESSQKHQSKPGRFNCRLSDPLYVGSKWARSFRNFSAGGT